MSDDVLAAGAVRCRITDVLKENEIKEPRQRTLLPREEKAAAPMPSIFLDLQCALEAREHFNLPSLGAMSY